MPLPARNSFSAERRAPFRRVAELECALRLRRQPASAQVSPCFRPFRRLQFFQKPAGRQLHHIMQARPLLIALFGLRVAVRQRHPGKRRNLFDGFRKIHTLQLNQKPEMIPRHAAAEAVVAPLAVLAVEARRFFAMERAVRPKVAAPGIGLFLVKRNPPADHRGDRHTVADVVQECRRKAHLASLPDWLGFNQRIEIISCPQVANRPNFISRQTYNSPAEAGLV